MEQSQIEQSRHAVQRLGQRGLRFEYIEWIMRIGTQTEDGIIVTDKNIKDAEQVLKRLRGKRIVIAGNTLVTAYHAHQAPKRKLLRATRERDLD